MKKIGFILLGLLLSIQIYAADGETVTTTNFIDVDKKGKLIIGENFGIENKYGEMELYKQATIETTNFKVENFWDKFSDASSGTSTYTQVSKSGIFRLTVQAGSFCFKGELPEEGCSGQKPFLIHSSVLNNDDLKIDIDGNSFTDIDGNIVNNIYRIPFDDAKNYINIDSGEMNTDAFYALNVKRNDDVYDGGKEPEEEKPKKFWQRIEDMFKSHYSYDISTSGDALDSDEATIMTRYIANINTGLDKEHKIDKTINTKVKQGDIINSPHAMRMIGDDEISLLDYSKSLLETKDGCSGFLLSYSPSSFRCKMMRSLGTASWMPFWNSSVDYDVQTTSVVKDTEMTLLQLAGEEDNTNYIKDTNTGDNSSFLSELIKPITNMMSGISRFWFGSDVKVAEAVSATYTFQNPIALNFITTSDGNVADGFANFKLLALESVYGTEITECTIKYNRPGIFSGWKTKKFIAGGTKTVNLISGAGWSPNSYPELEDEMSYETKFTFFPPSTYYDWSVPNDIVLSWCRRHPEGKDGIFTTIFKNFFSWINPTTIDTYEGQLDELFKDNRAYVDTYKEKVHRGLILKLQKEDIKLGQSGTSTTYKLMNVK